MEVLQVQMVSLIKEIQMVVLEVLVTLTLLLGLQILHQAMEVDSLVEVVEDKMVQVELVGVAMVLIMPKMLMLQILVQVDSSVSASATTGSPDEYTASGYKYYKFTGSGTLTL